MAEENGNESNENPDNGDETDDGNGTGAETNVGAVESVTGVVVDALFTDELPEIYSALHIKIDEADDRPPLDLVCEVQQHLGDDRVRAVAMDATDGLQRGDEVIDTGGPITVPVGEETLGRIFNLLGEAIDQGDPIEVEERLSLIHISEPTRQKLSRMPSSA